MAEIIGTQLRFLMSAVFFGVWQNNSYAAAFMYLALVTVDQRLK